MPTIGDCSDFIKHTLGGVPRGVSSADLVNRAGEFLCSHHPWNWLVRRSTTLDFLTNRNHLELPRDFRSWLGWSATNGLLNSLEFVDHEELLDFRTSQISVSPWHFYGAVTYVDNHVPNLLTKTEDFDETDQWDDGDTGTMSAENSTANPIDGAVTADTLDDASAVAQESVGQIVPSTSLTQGRYYTFSVYLLKGTAATSTSIKISVAGGADNTLGTITWPSGNDDPTFAVASSTGSGDNIGGMSIIGPKWVRAHVVVEFESYDGTAGGGILCEIMPSSATEVGTVIAWGAQCEEGKEPGPYHANPTTSVLTSGVGVRPVLEVWPEPTTDDLGAITIFYRAGWLTLPDNTKDSTDLRLPSWLDAVYFEILRAFAHGYDEHDLMTVDQRLQNVVAGHMMKSARDRDAAFQPDFGFVKGGAIQTTPRSVNRYSRSTVLGPS